MLAGMLASVTGCMPPSVKVVDTWLTAYASENADQMVSATHPEDRALLQRALSAQQDDPTSMLAMLLPTKPLSHEMLEIESKEPGRHVVLTKIDMKNPLAFSAKRVGHDMPDIPKQRSERRRFLSIETKEAWGVKLDLQKALRRMEFAAEFQEALRRRDYKTAQSMLTAVPPPPDEANALRKTDRLKENLEQTLKEKLRVKTSTAS